MAGKINDVSTDIMSYAINTIKEGKEKKAQQAFFSLLDTAVKAEQGNNQQKVPTESVSGSGSQKQEPVKSESVPEKETPPVKDNVSVKNTQKTDSKVQDEAPKTEFEEAEEIVKAICEELGISMEQLFQQLEQFTDAITALLVEQFGVTQQQVDVVLETLGLNVTDLLDTKNLMDVVVMLTGAEDISAVLTDETLYGQIREVMSGMEEILQEGIGTGTEIEKMPMPAQKLQTLEKSMKMISADVPETIPEMEYVAQKIQPQEQPSRLQAGVEMQSERVEESALPVMEVKLDEQFKEHTSQSGHQQLSGQEAFTQFTATLAEHVMQADVEMPVETFMQTEQMESIIRQVTEYVKLQVQSDTTSLEMQLHPESYGKLNLHVAVREGVVTARLAVENEMVRQALETQIVQLREDMNERGLAVDAVEVTIASHEFERNLEQDQQAEEGQQADNGTRKNIDLNNENLSLEEIMEMSEAESLARRMMLENGNTIDYSA